MEATNAEAMLGAMLALVTLHVLPRPVQVRSGSCRSSAVALARVAPIDTDVAALEEVNERWRPLGLPPMKTSSRPSIHLVRDASLRGQSYRLTVGDAGVTIRSSDPAGAFYAFMTLAQLPERDGGSWRLPCVDIADAPALPWRVLSDDVSRGPLPTMAYFRERIRTIAAFKMNAYSPYMEHVFVSPSDPLPAPLDGITPSQLHELSRYAARFHVTLIPEQQTFAHMHNTLRVEQYAQAAEFPHGFLLAPNAPAGSAYLERIIAQERAAIGPTPFFHIGSDETATLGEGKTATYVSEHGGRSAVYAQHVTDMAALVAPSRVMLWDDGIEADPSIMARIPRSSVIINWHYGAQASFRPFIERIAAGHLDQMVAPGANNWNEIYPDLDAAIPSEERFITQGIAAHVFGLFQTVWHDDGETLYEATWYPVLFAGSVAWSGSSSGFGDDFARAFFGTSDRRFGDDVRTLGDLAARLGDSTDKLFWADPFDAAAAERMRHVDLARLRLDAEQVASHLMRVAPPLHRNAASVMLLAARRYDALGRRYQIADEVRFYYDHAKTHPADAIRDLFWSKYWFWEQRDSDEMLAPLYAKAWRYESREGHLASNLERYHLDAQRAIERADAIDRVTYQEYVPNTTLPDLDMVIK